MASVLVDVALIGISYTLVLQAVFRLPFQDASTRLSTPVALTLESPLPHTFIFHITLARTFPTMYIFFLANLHVLVPPMLNPVIYGAKTKQMRGSMTHMVSAVEVLREGTALNAFSVSLTNMRERACW